MPDYKIIGCSTCDFDQKTMDDLDIAIQPLSFIVEGHEYKNYLDNREIAFNDYYKLLDEGKVSTTSQINVIDAKDFIRPYLQKGLDVLYLAFSSGLSGTYNSVRLAIDELKEEFPNNKMILIDTVAAAAGEGLIDMVAGLNKKKGMSLEENAKFIEDFKLRVRHWFTVDELDTLRRGGRVTASKAFAAKMFNIKPILNVDNAGRLVAVTKKIGHKTALKCLVENSLNNIDTNYPLVVANATNQDDLDYVLKCIDEGCKLRNIKVEVIKQKIGPVIGGHTGSSILAIFTAGDHR